jgi:hypothetical protein
LKSLQALDLGDTQVSDAGMKELAGVKTLRSLYLFHTTESSPSKATLLRARRVE